MTVAHNAGRCMGVKASKTRNARLRSNVAGCRHVENAAVTAWICILADSAISALSSSRARTAILSLSLSLVFRLREGRIIVRQSMFLVVIRAWVFSGKTEYRQKNIGKIFPRVEYIVMYKLPLKVFYFSRHSARQE